MKPNRDRIRDEKGRSSRARGGAINRMDWNALNDLMAISKSIRSR